MNMRVLRMIVLTDLRVRLRRFSTLAMLALVAAPSWLSATDWRSGMSMFVVGDTRVRYDSNALAMAGALYLSILFGLAGFYLARGRITEDARSGIGSVVASLAVSNAVLIVGRWLAAVIVLNLLVLAAMASAMVAYGAMSEGSLRILPYVQTYLLVMLPGVLFAASMATLCDAYAPLIGKLSDVAYFLLWMGCAFAMYMFVKDAQAAWNPLQLIDFAGLGTSLVRLAQLFANPDIRTGGRHSFDASLAPLLMPGGFWDLPMLARRLACSMIAVLPLWFAVKHFHRYSPDLLKPIGAGYFGAFSGFVKHLGAPLAMLNGASAHLLRSIKPALARSAMWPGLRGQLMAELNLTLLSNPVALPVMLLCVITGALWNDVLIFALLCWGVLISDISTREQQNGMACVSAATPGGTRRGYARQLLASITLGSIFASSVALSWLFSNPLGAAAIVAGIFLFSGAASLLGRVTGTPRTFLALFLFGVWVAEDNPTAPALDFVGAHAVTTPFLVALELAIALALCLAGFLYSQYGRRGAA